jgi:hypothetical protein
VAFGDLISWRRHPEHPIRFASGATGFTGEGTSMQNGPPNWTGLDGHVFHPGFNPPWPHQQRARGIGLDEPIPDPVAGWGSGFVRLPMDYRLWSVDGDARNCDEEILTRIDNEVIACCKRGLHLTLSLRGTPIPADRRAQDIFVAVWERIALRYRYVPRAVLSFGLVDETPAPGLPGFTREAQEQVIRRAVAAVRAVAPDRPLTSNGNAASGPGQRMTSLFR